MKKYEIYANLVFGVLILAATICYTEIDTSAYITKTIASVLFVLCGAFNLFCLYKNYKYDGWWKGIIMLVGLIFAMAGDIFLIDHFIFGAMLFAVGHVFFLIYFCLMQKFHLIDFILTISIIAMALLVILLYPYFEFNGMLPVILAYAVIISCMLAKGIGNYISQRNTANLITMLGAILFFFSDLMLLFFEFGGKIIIFDYLCLYTYYPGEFLLGVCILLNKNNYAKIFDPAKQAIVTKK